MCANIFIGGILDKGHTNPLERKRSGLIVGLTSIVALGIIYIILTYIGACGGDYYDPVSYTHLDVYKRQVLTCPLKKQEEA